ncbi:transketolase C-terminal domain-containing protein [Oscillospiraceae bacterium MB08-C2-2]|nr:transketolase C-terminal domain-containing protein [Oscillospiraceae bacterium MB08-C2-2]
MGKAIRDVYGEALVKYGRENKNVVVLDADVCSSTKSGLFAAAIPERFFNVGIAEADMVGIAAGLATTGKIPFVNTFAVFLASIGLIGARAFGSYSKLNVKFMGAYGGISDAYDGPSHHSLEDIAIMRALPNFQVFVAADEYQTDWLVKNAIEVDAPMYIRLSRDATPTVYSADTKFETGKGMILREGKDATIIACGVMVGQAVAAAEELAKKGIEVRVVDMFSIKPIDRELILESAAKTGAIVTAEEHNIIGGLGGAVAEVLSAGGANAVQEFIGLQDLHAECGSYNELLTKYGLDVPAVIAAVEKAIARK